MSGDIDATPDGGTDTGTATDAGSGTNTDADADAESGLTALVSGVRIGQFVSVGVAGATLETVIVALLTTTVAASPLAAKAVGAEASISLMFLLNDRYTFGKEGAAGAFALARRWGRSHLVRIGGLSVAFATLWLLTAQTDLTLVVAGRDLWPTVANLVGIGVGLTLNYVAESVFTWRVLE
ncbi:GtrA family protein [Halobaculum limi]|uniref:GtrA family protein n=1 Tax=Halobaculum limi TaxID=3031916 RepID=UPI0024062D49|nr:GtrA family protein [Halobaculum sp. YSMS11]